MAKKRGRNQELEEESRNALRTALKSWVVNDLYNDFGLDFIVQLAKPDNEELREITPLSCYIQLKASKRFNESDTVYWDFDTDFVESYWNCSIPVVLMLYEAETESFYWTVLQQYVHEELTTIKPEWWSQNTVRISVNRTEELHDIDEFGKCISEITRRIEQRRSQHMSPTSRVGKQTREDSVNHLVNYQTSLVERAEQKLDENNDAAKYLLRRLKSSVEMHDDPDEYVMESDSIASSTYLFGMYNMCKQAKYLCDEIQSEEQSEYFYSKSNDFRSFIYHHMVGNEYLDCEIGERFIIVDVFDLVPDMDTGFWMALQQYEDGMPWDENPEAIAKRIDYQLLEYNSTELRTNLQNKCPDGSHDFEVVGIERDSSTRRAAFCRNCGLSKEVIAEFCSEEAPIFCEMCGVLSEEYNFVDDRCLCPECAAGE